MRNLTLKRRKSFVGCLAKMKIYIEDPTANELIINGVPCRKLGDLKNGEEKTFSIGEQAAKIFVIADTLSRGFCNEYYSLPAGQEDISLSGQNKLNPASGNAFRFDGNESEGIAENRKKGNKKGLIILIIAALIGMAVGFGATSLLLSPSEQRFSAEEMSITLTNEFRETEAANYTAAYDSRNVAVFALKESFSLAEGFEDLTLKEYADLVKQANNLRSAKTQTENGLTYFEYDFTNPETKEEYHYFSYVYKADDAFWLIQFTTLTNNRDTYAPKISAWAQSVTFSR